MALAFKLLPSSNVIIGSSEMIARGWLKSIGLPEPDERLVGAKGRT